VKTLLALLEILDSGGLVGKSKPLIQQLGYFVDVFFELGLRYVLHYRGVYSARLDFSIGRAIAVGFVGTNPMGAPCSRPHYFSEMQYGLLGDGREALALLRKRHPALSAQLREKLEAIAQATRGDPTKLALASSMHISLPEGEQGLSPDGTTGLNSGSRSSCADDIVKSVAILHALGLTTTKRGVTATA
jgi:hypothetical protein